MQDESLNAQKLLIMKSKLKKVYIKMIWKSRISLVGKSIYSIMKVIFHYLFQIF